MSKLQHQLCEAIRQSLSGQAPIVFPEAGELLWQWFCDLHSSRTWHANGPNPISYGEIAIYRQLSGWPMEERHVRILRAMDDTWLSAFYERQNRPEKSDKALPAASGRTMTPALFDAMFG